MEQLLSTNDVAARMGVSRQHVVAYILRYDLPAKKLNPKKRNSPYVINETEYHKWLEQVYLKKIHRKQGFASLVKTGLNS